MQPADLILEAGFMDLYEFTSDMRLTGQDVLHVNAAKWTRQITEGIAVRRPLSIPERLRGPTQHPYILLAYAHTRHNPSRY